MKTSLENEKVFFLRETVHWVIEDPLTHYIVVVLCTTLEGVIVYLNNYCISTVRLCEKPNQLMFNERTMLRF